MYYGKMSPLFTKAALRFNSLMKLFSNFLYGFTNTDKVQIPTTQSEDSKPKKSVQHYITDYLSHHYHRLFQPSNSIQTRILFEIISPYKKLDDPLLHGQKISYQYLVFQLVFILPQEKEETQEAEGRFVRG